MNLRVSLSMVFLLLITGSMLSAWSLEPTIASGRDAVQGGADYPQWLEQACRFAHKLIQYAPDTIGKKTTPLWLSGLDPDATPETGGLITHKPPTWQMYWEAEDYVMTVQGCNMLRDMPTLTAFEQLTKLTQDECYKRKVEEYLSYWLAECPSPQTGLFPWGEHMSYNCVRDKLIAKRHELEYNLPDWSLLWSLNAEAVRKEIEAIYRIHIWDKDEFLYDRHGNYYTGEFDAPSVRGTYIKHSALFAHAFLFLYSKTQNPEHLHWAQQAADLYWRHRNTATNLIPGYVAHDDNGAGNCTDSLQVAYYLLEGLHYHDDPFIRERALGMINAFLQYGINLETGETAAELDVATGKVNSWATATWCHNGGGGYFAALALWDAYDYTREPRYLTALEARLKRLEKESLSERITPDAAGNWLKLFVRAYRATGDKTYLLDARSLADWSVKLLVKNDLIIEFASGYVYLNYSRPGDLMSGWLELYQAELERPFHWEGPQQATSDAHSIQIKAVSKKTENQLRLTWRFHNATSDSDAIAIDPKTGLFNIPIPADVKQGPMTLTFRDLVSDQILDQGTILVAANPHGPRIDSIDCPRWTLAKNSLKGHVRVVDDSGVNKVNCSYQLSDGAKGTVDCSAMGNDKERYEFEIPPQELTKAESITLTIMAEGNPQWPIQALSSPIVIPIGTVASDLSDPVQPCDNAIPYITTCGQAVEQIRLTSSPYGNMGLPTATIQEFWVIGSENKAGDRPLEMQFHYHLANVESILPSTLQLYQWDKDSWRKVPNQTHQVDARVITASCSVGQDVYVLGGEPRLSSRRSFNGCLMSSPAAARINSDGALAIILDTGDADGVLYALNSQGETLWTYDAEGEQSFPAVADINGDGLDEIAVGGNSLTVLSSAGSVLWKTLLEDCNTPAIGKANEDKAMEIVATSDQGVVAVYSVTGEPLMRINEVADSLKMPVLAHLVEQEPWAIVAGGKECVVAVSRAGNVAWKTSVEGDVAYAPAAGDLDGDGKDEIAAFSRTDTKGTLSLINPDGAVRWSFVVSRETDWSPVMTELDGAGKTRILVQLPDPRQVGVLDQNGQLVRTIDTTGRSLQTWVPVDLNNDEKKDLLCDEDLTDRLYARDNSGKILWSYTPHSYTLPGAKIKGGGSLLVADINGDERLEIVGGDDETWLNILRTDTACKRWAVVSGQYHGDCRHTGFYKE
jgi:hypothetical protein